MNVYFKIKNVDDNIKIVYNIIKYEKERRMNKKLLKSKMVLEGDTNETLASKINITKSSFSNKLNDRRSFTKDEMLKIKIIYNLTEEEFFKIFFESDESK